MRANAFLANPQAGTAGFRVRIASHRLNDNAV
jgi:hypothetical protein